MLDWKISGGTVLDGYGGPAVRADVGVCGDTITGIGDLRERAAKHELDASSMLVCPGFIDAHSHSDAFLLIEPSAPSKIHQGITTEIVGNCGSSAAPLTRLSGLPHDWAEQEYPGSWRSMAEYIELLEQQRPAPNVVPLVGHARLRERVMGFAGRAPDPAELSGMSYLLEESLEQGGRGLSAGLIYAPGMYSTPDELAELARVVARRGGVYSCHMRSEGRGLLEAIEESIAIGRETGVRVQISHLKTAGRANWHLADRALELIREARAGDVAVFADRYPYTSSCTELDVIFPHWAAEGGRAAALSRLRDPVKRRKLRRDILARHDAGSWASIIIGSTTHPENKRFEGKPLLNAAEELNLEPVDAALDIIDRDNLTTGAFFAGMSDENMWKIFAEPYVMLGTDASLRSPSGPLSHGYPHPRAYGSMPRFLRAALDGKTVSVTEAVRKMTSLPAEQFMLRNRGRIAEGRLADIVVFDPDITEDKATNGNPHQFAAGCIFVMVNGVATLDSGGFTGMRAGRVLC